MSHFFIINPSAGGGRAMKRWREAASLFHRAGLATDHIFTSKPGEATTIARELSGKYRTLIAVGGDGTVNEVANGILASNSVITALTTLPLGTGNDISRLAGISSARDCLAALHGNRLLMDVIEVQCQDRGTSRTHHALLFAAAGFAAEVLKRTTARIKRIAGPKLCYSVGLFRALIGYRASHFEASAGPHKTSAPLLLACAGNAEFAGGGRLRLCPGARVDDSLLNISLVENLPFWRVARHFPNLADGTYTRLPEARYFTGTRLELSATPPTEVQVDGDIIGLTPAVFQLKPKALQLLCP